MGSGARLCLAAIGVYSVIISLAFLVVTVLYTTITSDSKNTNYNAKTAKNINELVH